MSTGVREYDEAVAALAKCVVRIRFSVYQPPEVYAAQILNDLVELGFVVAPSHSAPSSKKARLLREEGIPGGLLEQARREGRM